MPLPEPARARPGAPRSPLARGRSADVFALDEVRVLRRYRDGHDATAEAELMAYLTRLGYPVPEVYAVRGPDLVMERIDGPTLLDAAVSGSLDVRDVARVLADLHTRLHALPAPDSPDPADRVLHLDLHPGNVMLRSRAGLDLCSPRQRAARPRGGRTVVIDWCNAAAGEPDLDLAMTALIMAQVAVDPTDPLAATAAAVVRAFLALAGGDPRRLLDEAVSARAADPGLTPDEIGRLPEAAAMVAAGG